MSILEKRVQILGTRGIPARHGGFETFAEQLSLYLIERDWDVTVYCQLSGDERGYVDLWHGITRVHLSAGEGPLGTIQFDYESVREANKRPGLPLVLGYNTAVFHLLLRLKGRKVLTNMDGIEWKRAKWSPSVRAWLWLNEYLACKLSSHMIADHPAIKSHLLRHSSHDRIAMIPYGADRIDDAIESHITSLGLVRDNYLVVIARPEPENSVLEIVRAFSTKRRDMFLVLVGNYRPDKIAYHAQVMEAAGPDCIFPGAIYDRDSVDALRFYARAYIHGHQVGGTNPSLVAALAAGRAIIAHDNQFVRWVAEDAAVYFTNEDELGIAIDSLTTDISLAEDLGKAAGRRHASAFTRESILSKYEDLLSAFQ